MDIDRLRDPDNSGGQPSALTMQSADSIQGVSYGATAQQGACSFFEKLPAELRVRIYEFALGYNTIHIEDYDTCECDVHVSTDRGPHGERQKVAATVCACPHDTEEKAYELSKSNAIPQNLFETEPDYLAPKLSPDFLDDYLVRHQLCFQIQDSFARGIYADDTGTVYRTKCQVDEPICNIRGDCKHYQEVVQKFGEPLQGGLKRMYPNARYNMSLLLACRQIYMEARMVPYYANTFSFFEAKVVKTFAKNFLKKRARMAIRHIQISGVVDLVHDTKTVCKALPGLHFVDLFLDSLEMETDDEVAGRWSSSYSPELEEPLVYDARVTVGDDSNHRMMERPERREVAEKLENIISFKKGSAGQDSDDVESMSSLGYTHPPMNSSLDEFHHDIPPTGQ